jgi:hypothetical protein
VALLTDPSFCAYSDKGVPLAFATNLFTEAQAVLAGYDVDAVREMTVLLRTFNLSGVTNALPPSLLECSPSLSKKELKSISRDPTTQLLCPGVNDACTAAEVVAFPNQDNPFAIAKYKAKVNLTKYSDQLPAPPCSDGGRDAVWRILPETALAGRRFTVDTEGSNLDTVVSVFQGDCDNPTFVACNDDYQEQLPAGGVATFPYSHVSFTTDGTNTYFVVVESKGSNFGKAKVVITSP